MLKADFFRKKNRMVFFIGLAFFCFFFSGLFSNVFAAPITWTPQVPIPGFTSTTITPNSLAEYIKAVHKFGVQVLGVLAVIIIMAGGFQWMTAGGNPGTITEAKKRISYAFIGLLLGIGSYFILATINIKLVQFKSLNVETVRGITQGQEQSILSGISCESNSGSCRDPYRCYSAAGDENFCYDPTKEDIPEGGFCSTSSPSNLCRGNNHCCGLHTKCCDEVKKDTDDLCIYLENMASRTCTGNIESMIIDGERHDYYLVDENIDVVKLASCEDGDTDSVVDMTGEANRDILTKMIDNLKVEKGKNIEYIDRNDNHPAWDEAWNRYCRDVPVFGINW